MESDLSKAPEVDDDCRSSRRSDPFISSQNHLKLLSDGNPVLTLNPNHIHQGLSSRRQL